MILNTELHKKGYTFRGHAPPAFTGLNWIQKSLLSTVDINNSEITMNKQTGSLYRHTQKNLANTWLKLLSISKEKHTYKLDSKENNLPKECTQSKSIT